MHVAASVTMEEASIVYLGGDRALAKLLEARMERGGVKVGLASDVATGLGLLHRSGAKILLLDEKISSRNSLALAAKMRRVFPKGKVAIIWHPENATRDKIVAAARAGIDGALIRPLNFGRLVKMLNGLLPPGKQFQQDGGVPDQPQEALQEAVLNKLKSIKTLTAVPYVVEKVLDITGNDASSAKDLGKIIESDPQVAAVILKRANSSYYRAVNRIQRVHDAVMRIGFVDVRGIVLGLSVMDMFPNDQKNLGFDRMEFWKSSLLCALLARRIARISEAADPEDAFIAGLLHDLGRIILDEHFDEEFQQAMQAAEQFKISLLEAERRIFGLDHQRVGRFVLEHWNVPDSLVEVISSHEEYDHINHIPEEARPLARVIHASICLSRLLPFGSSGERVIPELPPALAEDLKLDEVVSGDWIQPLMDEIGDMISFIGANVSAEVKLADPDQEEPFVVLYDDGNPLISPNEYLFRGAGYGIRRAKKVENISKFEGAELVVLDFNDAKALKDAAELIPKDRPRMAITIPGNAYPKDDKVKERVGLPIQNTVYMDKPTHMDDFWAHIQELTEPGS